MRRRTLRTVCFSTVVLAVAAPHASAGSFDAIKPQFDIWVKCALDNASEIADQEGDPVSLSAAAMAMCRSERVNVSSVLQRRGHRAKRKFLQALEKNIRELTLARIVEMRTEQPVLKACSKDDSLVAIEACSQLIRKYPNHVIAFVWRCWAHLNRENFDAAIGDCTSAIEKGTKNHSAAVAEAFSGRGWAQFKKLKSGSALADFMSAVAIQPKNATRYVERGIALSDLHRFEEAVSDFTTAIELDPAHAAAYLRRGYELDARGYLDAAIVDFSEAIRLKPTGVSAYTARGYSYLQQSLPELARADFEKAVALAGPNDATASENARKGLALAAAVGSAPPPSSDPPPGLSLVGSGIVLTSKGHVATNAHVIEACSGLSTGQPGSSPRPAKTLAVDEKNDIALLEVDLQGAKPLSVRRDLRVGEFVYAFGFPLVGLLSSSGNFTSGNSTALTGIRNDITRFQFSAPIQPGNSGGPVLDQLGNVVGMAVAKLDTLVLADLVKDVAQNVNFAIKGRILADFVEALGVKVNSQEGGPTLEPALIAERAKAGTIAIYCLITRPSGPKASSGQQGTDNELERRQGENTWAIAKLLETPEKYEDYLKRFPNGVHAKEAQQRLAALQERETVLAPTKELQVLPHMSIEGGDIQLSNWPSMDRSACRQACQTEPKCIAYSHDAWSGKCFLKDSTPLMRLEPNYELAVTRGLATPPRSPDTVEIKRRSNKSFGKMGEGTARRAADFEECALACMKQDTCWYLQFSPEQNCPCMLYGNAPEYTDAQGSDVGVKWQPYR